MSFPTLLRWFEKKPSSPQGPTPPRPLDKPRSKLRVGIPRVLNMWSTHQFWVGFLTALGIDPNRIDFSSDTSEDQAREFAKGRGTVDCCYPVKCVSGHYGELLMRQKHRKIDILLSPMIYSLPSMLQGQVMNTIACPRVMATPENIKSGFMKEKDAFEEAGVRYVAPLVYLGEPELVPGQLFQSFRHVLAGLTEAEIRHAVDQGFAALRSFNDRARRKSREVLEQCARDHKPCLLVVARPYHMDPGIGHEIEVDLQAHGYPILWAQYLPTDDDLMQWLFADDMREGFTRSPFDISDVWPSSYSSNTNEILWGAKVAARMPWITGVIRLASYECGMDQPTYTPVQQIIERSGTLFFSFQELDSTKPSGSVKIRVETIAHYLQKYADGIIDKKLASSPPDCPLLPRAGAAVTAASGRSIHA